MPVKLYGRSHLAHKAFAPGTKFCDLEPPVKAVELIWVKIPGGETQVSGMFACDYILYADYCGMPSFSVSYMSIKIKVLP